MVLKLRKVGNKYQRSAVSRVCFVREERIFSFEEILGQRLPLVFRFLNFSSSKSIG